MIVFQSDAGDLFAQKRLALKVQKETTELISLLNKGLNVHLNVGLQFTVNTPGVFMSLEGLEKESLANKEILMVANARLRLPSTFNLSLNTNFTPSLRVRARL